MPYQIIASTIFFKVILYVIYNFIHYASRISADSRVELLSVTLIISVDVSFSFFKFYITNFDQFGKPLLSHCVSFYFCCWSCSENATQKTEQVFPHSFHSINTKLKIKCLKLPHWIFFLFVLLLVELMLLARRPVEKFDVEKLITYYYNQLYGIQQIVFDSLGGRDVFCATQRQFQAFKLNTPFNDFFQF